MVFIMHELFELPARRIYRIVGTFRAANVPSEVFGIFDPEDPDCSTTAE